MHTGSSQDSCLLLWWYGSYPPNQASSLLSGSLIFCVTGINTVVLYLWTVTAWSLTPVLGDRGHLSKPVVVYGLALWPALGGTTLQGCAVFLRHPQPRMLPPGLVQYPPPSGCEMFISWSWSYVLSPVCPLCPAAVLGLQVLPSA